MLGLEAEFRVVGDVSLLSTLPTGHHTSRALTFTRRPHRMGATVGWPVKPQRAEC